MNTRRLSIFSLLTSILVCGCAGGSDDAEASLNDWLGEEKHLAISGTLQDKTFDFRLEGDAAAGVYCNRFYAPMPGAQPDADGKYDTSQLFFVMKELGSVIELDGQPTNFSISYWRHDVPAGTDLVVIPRIFGSSIPEGQTWSDVNLFAPGTNPVSGIETAASSGTVSMRLNTGSLDSGGVMIPDGGRTGEFISVSWGPRESLAISATADCGPAQLAPWALTRIKP